MSKTTENAAYVLSEIIAETKVDVIKYYEMPSLCNIQKGIVTGFAVILTLSTKYEYTSAILENWRKRMDASDYKISVKRNQLQVTFYVMYD